MISQEAYISPATQIGNSITRSKRQQHRCQTFTRTSANGHHCTSSGLLRSRITRTRAWHGCTAGQLGRRGGDERCRGSAVYVCRLCGVGGRRHGFTGHSGGEGTNCHRRLLNFAFYLRHSCLGWETADVVKASSACGEETLHASSSIFLFPKSDSQHFKRLRRGVLRRRMPFP